MFAQSCANRFLLRGLSLSASSSGILIGRKQTIFSDVFLHMDKFAKTRETKLSSSTPQTLESLKQELTETLKTGTRINRQHIEDLFYLSESKSDFELATSAFKNYLKVDMHNDLTLESDPVNIIEDKEVRKKKYDQLVYLFSKSFYRLRLIDAAKRLYEDQDLLPLRNHPYPILLAMNLFVQEKHYQLLIDLFEKHMNIYPQIDEEKTFISNKHLALWSEAVFLHTHADCYRHEKDDLTYSKNVEKVIDQLNFKECKLGGRSAACLIMFSLKHKKLSLAKKILDMIDDEESGSLKTNLSIIMMAQTHRVMDAFGLAFKQLKTIKKKDSSNLTGRFFPYTLKCIKEEIESNGHNDETFKKYAKLERKCVIERRLYKSDIVEFCTYTPPTVEQTSSETSLSINQ